MLIFLLTITLKKLRKREAPTFTLTVKYFIIHGDSIQNSNSVKSSRFYASEQLDYRRLPKPPADKSKIYEFIKHQIQNCWFIILISFSYKSSFNDVTINLIQSNQLNYTVLLGFDYLITLQT